MAQFKLIGCEVLRPEAEYLLQALGCQDNYDCQWFPMGLHEMPDLLHTKLKTAINECAGKKYEAIVLLFGLCSRATAQLTPPPGMKLVIPKVHDCVALHLGSAELHRREQDNEAGTFWFSRGFLHREDGASYELSGLGAVGSAVYEIGENGQRKSAEQIREEFCRQYGEENADYLLEVLVDSWKKNYSRAVYLEWEKNPDLAADRQTVQSYAQANGWKYQTRSADFRLVEMLLAGKWSEKEFVVVEPGQRLIATHDDEGIRAG